MTIVSMICFDSESGHPRRKNSNVIAVNISLVLQLEGLATVPAHQQGVPVSKRSGVLNIDKANAPFPRRSPRSAGRAFSKGGL